MIGYLSGVALEISESNVIILTSGGVGYELSIPISLSGNLHKGNLCDFFVYTHVREDILALYGFAKKEELLFFKQLISVSGIGPKVALAIISSAPIEKLKSSIAKGDSTLLSAVSGVGKKTAEKAVVELRNKVGLVLESTGGSSSDILDALLGLGFQRSDAINAISNLPEGLESDEQKIKAALKVLAK